MGRAGQFVRGLKFNSRRLTHSSPNKADSIPIPTGGGRGEREGRERGRRQASGPIEATAACDFFLQSFVA